MHTASHMLPNALQLCCTCNDTHQTPALSVKQTSASSASELPAVDERKVACRLSRACSSAAPRPHMPPSCQCPRLRLPPVPHAAQTPAAPGQNAMRVRALPSHFSRQGVWRSVTAHLGPAANLQQRLQKWPGSVWERSALPAPACTPDGGYPMSVAAMRAAHSCRPLPRTAHLQLGADCQTRSGPRPRCLCCADHSSDIHEARPPTMPLQLPGATCAGGTQYSAAVCTQRMQGLRNLTIHGS